MSTNDITQLSLHHFGVYHVVSFQWGKNSSLFLLIDCWMHSIYQLFSLQFLLCLSFQIVKCLLSHIFLLHANFSCNIPGLLNYHSQCIAITICCQIQLKIRENQLSICCLCFSQFAVLEVTFSLISSFSQPQFRVH